MKVKIKVTPPVDKSHRDKLTVGSIHETIPAPKAHAKNTRRSEVWVMGAGEPVKLFASEYEETK